MRDARKLWSGIQAWHADSAIFSRHIRKNRDCQTSLRTLDIDIRIQPGLCKNTLRIGMVVYRTMYGELGTKINSSVEESMFANSSPETNSVRYCNISSRRSPVLPTRRLDIGIYTLPDVWCPATMKVFDGGGARSHYKQRGRMSRVNYSPPLYLHHAVVLVYNENAHCTNGRLDIEVLVRGIVVSNLYLHAAFKA